jgi:hypothetical protein
MATDLDMANAALGLLGQDPLTTLNNSVNAKQIPLVNRYLPMAKASTLRERDWNCVRGRAALQLLTTDESLGEWTYSYRLPQDCLCIRRFISIDGRYAYAKYSVEIDAAGKRVIHTDIGDAKIIYTRNVTNVTVWDQNLFDACTAQLAMRLTGPITRDFKMAQVFMQDFQMLFEKAIASDEGEGNIEIITNSPLVDVRG